MITDKIDFKPILLVLIIIFLTFFAGRLVAQSTPVLPLVLMLGVMACFLGFSKPDLALILLIFAMLLSPEIALGKIPKRSITFRLDDIILIVIFLGWIANTAINKELGLLRATPINKPIIAYIFICIFSSAIGILQGRVNPGYSFFYILKYIEYFLLFFMVSNHIKDRVQIKRFLFFMFITCFIVSVYALRFHFVFGGRASAPFEGATGEANTLAGYLILIMGMLLGIILYSRKIKIKILLGAFLGFITLPFIYTFSRSGWAGFLSMFLAFVVFTKRYRGILLIILICGIIASPFIFPRSVYERIEYTFGSGITYRFFGMDVKLEESAGARVRSFVDSFQRWKKKPFLGYGVAEGRVIYDMQYARLLREVGFLGFLAFVWIVVNLFRAGWKSFKNPNIDDLGRGLGLGFICILIGFLVMSLGDEVFIIIRIMEPFWFLAGIIVMMPRIYPSPEPTSTENPSEGG